MKRSLQTTNEGIPEGSFYANSYMHRDIVSHLLFVGEHLISASIDGHLKFWKRQVDPKKEGYIEFIKNFKAHDTPIIDIRSSPNRNRLASLSLDGTLRIFDLEMCDLLYTIVLPSNPRAFSFLTNDSLIISQRKESFGDLWYISLLLPINECIKTISTTHKTLINKIISNSSMFITFDTDGVIKYWSHPLTTTTIAIDITPKKNKFSIFLSNRALSVEFSPSFDLFCIYSTDKCILMFKTESGKLYRIYKEDHCSQEFIKKIEEDLSKTPYWECKNVIFDESGRFLIFSSPSGYIKVLDHLNNNVVSKIGGGDIPPLYPLNISLFKGLPKNWASIKGGLSIEMASSSSFARDDSSFLVFTSWKRGRFFILANDIDVLPENRDISNESCGIEVCQKEENDASSGGASIKIALNPKIAFKNIYKKAIIRTSLGDVSFIFFENCPLAVENFCKLAQRKYYDGTIFHRVIENFMLQGGDPTGSGEGGKSCWGDVFEDEIIKGISNFDKPFLVAMANSGPNSNGSQFFITVAECPWLDDKHTIFGKVISGQDVLLMISKTATNQDDRPLKDVKVVEIDIE